ncbi:rap GTPase-activating protein, putative, partial [Ixodes scapularis]
DLLLLEEQEGSVNFKFGVLYAEAGQNTDDEMFSNELGSREFDRFVNLLGEKVRLKGWDKYRGGLDVKGDMTGKYSVYTIYEGHEIIFHVSTLLPYSKDNKQQVERKRHIGNDIVNIIFLNGSYEDHCNFKPSMIKSQFTHIFAVVSYIREEDAYRISLFSEESVPLFGPSLPCPPVFQNHQEFREFVLVKLINGEKAAFNTPIFAQKRERTLDMLIKDLYNEHMSDSRSNMLNRRAFSDVLPETPRGSRRKEEARQVEFVRIGQALKLDTIVKGDAPTSLATTSLFKREPWEPQCFYPDFPHEIICGDSWGNNKLILGTEAGIFLIEEGLTHRLIFDKTVQVKQISVVEAHGILLFRTDRGRDSRVHVFRLTDFEGDATNALVRSRPDLREHKLERTKGQVHVFRLTDFEGDATNALVRSRPDLREHKLERTKGQCSFIELAICPKYVRNLPNSELWKLPKLPHIGQLELSDMTIFDLVHFNLLLLLLLVLVRAHEQPRPSLIMLILWVCTANNTTHFQKLSDENTTEFDFQWNAVPDNIVCVFPYIMAFTYESIEIRLIINGNLVHNMVMPKLKLITSKSDIFFVSTAPEFFQVRKERVKEDRMERDPSVSPPSSPHWTCE